MSFPFTHCSLKAANGHPFPMAAPIEVDICTRVVRSIHFRPMPEEKGTEISKGPPSLSPIPPSSVGAPVQDQVEDQKSLGEKLA